jgi:hypothetical protein
MIKYRIFRKYRGAKNEKVHGIHRKLNIYKRIQMFNIPKSVIYKLLLRFKESL